MKNEELLHVIGNLDESMLAECEYTKPRRVTHSVWRFAAAAALVSLLAVTAYAAGFDFLNLGTISHDVNYQRIDWVDFEIDENGVAGQAVSESSTQGIYIRAQIPTNPDAPRALETAYLPTVPDHWVPANAWYALSGEDFSQFGVSWEPFAGEDGCIDSNLGTDGNIAEDCVSFRQFSAYFYNHAVGGEYCLDTLLCIPERVQVTSEVVTLGGISVLRVDIPAFRLTEDELLDSTTQAAYMAEGEIHLFWSDGSSILELICPGWFADSQLEELLTSLYPMDNIQDYLDDQIQRSNGKVHHS